MVLQFQMKYMSRKLIFINKWFGNLNFEISKLFLLVLLVIRTSFDAHCPDRRLPGLR